MENETQIQTIANQYLGRDVTVQEIELMPHILHLVINNADINPNFLDKSEKLILDKWKDERLIIIEDCYVPLFRFKINSKLLNAITEIIKIVYCQKMTF